MRAARDRCAEASRRRYETAAGARRSSRRRRVATAASARSCTTARASGGCWSATTSSTFPPAREEEPPEAAPPAPARSTIERRARRRKGADSVARILANSLVACDTCRAPGPRAARAGGERRLAQRKAPRPRLCSGTLLDRDVDQVAPFRPRAVVVPHLLVAEQFAQDEP